MYGLPEDVVMEIMGAAGPYASFSCMLIDTKFQMIVDKAAKMGGPPTPMTIKVLEDLVESVLHRADKESDGLMYVNVAFTLLGWSRFESLGELDYRRMFRAMLLLLPYLVRIWVKRADAVAEETTGAV